MEDTVDVLLIEQPGGVARHVDADLFWNDELWTEVSVELEQGSTESCNPYCASASASVLL